MGGETALGYLVHTFTANLHFHPLVLWTKHGDVKTLITVRLRHRQPVAHTLRVGLVHVGDDGEGLPALHLLLVGRGVDDDADGKKVVDAFKTAFLLLHLLPDAVDALRPALHVETEAKGFQLLLDRTDEALDVGVAGALRGVEFFLDHVVGIVLKVFQAQVFQLALQLVKAEFVGKGGVEVRGFFRHTALFFHMLGVADLAHQVHALGYHDEYHAHVLGEGDEKVAEILALHGWTLHIELLDALQTVDDVAHSLAKQGVDFFNTVVFAKLAGIDEDGQQALAFQAYLVDGDAGGLQTKDQGVEAEDVVLDDATLKGRLDELVDFRTVLGLKQRREGGEEGCQFVGDGSLFYFCE